ncbi:hypothetical protein BDN70DRAFT_878952 [Pholiota conissans]|uniref:Uncharacterized protein n=1 Tax=Pholiota conissans TaxID=109636 RepID=A0A9P5Z2V7_9AGAR|nr:hypothetical protein BDN70DRAFT_878952 [Pholiota conissans]
MSPGDPASSPLDQREEQSAKIVFENAALRKESVSGVCLDHPSLSRSNANDEREEG